jgi:hypothetical protein
VMSAAPIAPAQFHVASAKPVAMATAFADVTVVDRRRM